MKKIILLPGGKAVDAQTIDGPICIWPSAGSKWIVRWQINDVGHTSPEYDSREQAESVYQILVDAWAENSGSEIVDRSGLGSVIGVSKVEGGDKGPVWLHLPDGKMVLSNKICGVSTFKTAYEGLGSFVVLDQIDGPQISVRVGGELERASALADAIKAVLVETSPRKRAVVEFTFKG